MKKRLAKPKTRALAGTGVRARSELRASQLTLGQDSIPQLQSALGQRTRPRMKPLPWTQLQLR